jgi:hypothetical protein
MLPSAEKDVVGVEDPQVNAPATNPQGPWDEEMVN